MKIQKPRLYCFKCFSNKIKIINLKTFKAIKSRVIYIFIIFVIVDVYYCFLMYSNINKIRSSNKYHQLKYYEKVDSIEFYCFECFSNKIYPKSKSVKPRSKSLNFFFWYVNFSFKFCSLGFPICSSDRNQNYKLENIQIDKVQSCLYPLEITLSGLQNRV